MRDLRIETLITTMQANTCGCLYSKRSKASMAVGEITFTKIVDQHY